MMNPSTSLRPIWLLALLLACSAPPALAQECGGQTQADLNICADANYRAADVALNKAYRALADRLKDEAPSLSALVKAEKAWVTWRDAECGFTTAGFAQGSIHPMLVLICMERLTQARTRQLQAYTNCKEDTDCPAPKR